MPQCMIARWSVTCQSTLWLALKRAARVRVVGVSSSQRPRSLPPVGKVTAERESGEPEAAGCSIAESQSGSSISSSSLCLPQPPPRLLPPAPARAASG
ncbi:hypothetical protein DFP73DRAFT_570682 [Morchella snyderi]|nr:hypothetical protein DFP73DRAFT_570682 [Morchella snyderi]